MITLNLENIYRSLTGAKEEFQIKGKLKLLLDFVAQGSVDIRLAGFLYRLDDGIRLEAFGKAKFKTACDRCIEDFDISFDINFEMFATNSETEHLKNRTLTLDNQLAENIILSLPIKKICKDACLGLCPKCGQNLNSKKCDCKNTASKKTPFSKILKGQKNGPTEEKNFKNKN